MRPGAVVAAALLAVAVVAALVDGRLLVADPDASVVTAADVRLARALLGGAVPADAVAEACVEDGAIDPACLGDGRAADVAAEVVPRACRHTTWVDAGCVEERMGVEVPDRCDDGGVDVSCLAGTGTLLVLTDGCLVGDRLRRGCLTDAVYGVPDPGGGGGAAASGRAPGGSVGGGGGDPGDDHRADDAVPDDGDGPRRVVGSVVSGGAIVVLLAVAAVVLVADLRAVARWRPPAPVRRRAGGGEDDRGHDRAVLSGSLDEGVRRIDDTDDPRAAVIAAYAALLDGLAACAQGRRPTDTALEHLERVLAGLAVRPAPLRTLVALFEEARFSDHPITVDHRDRARAALREAAADLAATEPAPEAVR